MVGSGGTAVKSVTPSCPLSVFCNAVTAATTWAPDVPVAVGNTGSASRAVNASRIAAPVLSVCCANASVVGSLL